MRLPLFKVVLIVAVIILVLKVIDPGLDPNLIMAVGANAVNERRKNMPVKTDPSGSRFPGIDLYNQPIGMTH